MQPGASYEQLTKIPQIRNAVIQETIIAIKEGILKKKQTIPLFEVANSQYYINIERKHWKRALSTAIDYFVELEDYDKCIECRELIKKLK